MSIGRQDGATLKRTSISQVFNRVPILASDNTKKVKVESSLKNQQPKANGSKAKIPSTFSSFKPVKV